MPIIEILSFVKMYLIYELGEEYGNLKYHVLYGVCGQKNANLDVSNLWCTHIAC
jgi:hypothetical protein